MQSMTHTIISDVFSLERTLTYRVSRGVRESTADSEQRVDVTAQTEICSQKQALPTEALTDCKTHDHNKYFKYSKEIPVFPILDMHVRNKKSRI